jgi:hypothetical protein
MDVPLDAWAMFVPAIDVEMRLSGVARGTVTFQPAGAPAQAPCAVSTPGTAVSCRYALPEGSTGVFRGVAGAGATFDGIAGPCAESSAGEPVPVCTYRGIGFLRVFSGLFR